MLDQQFVFSLHEKRRLKAAGKEQVSASVMERVKE
jgi:hypothetical protein